MLVAVRAELGDDEPRLDIAMLDEDVDEDARPTGVYYSYVPPDSEEDDGVSIPDMLAAAIVNADDIDDEVVESEPPTRAAGAEILITDPPLSRRLPWRMSRPRRYLTRFSALAAMLALVVAIAAWLTWPRPIDPQPQLSHPITAGTRNLGR